MPRKATAQRTAQIVSLKLAPQPKPDQDTIRTLRYLLKQAEAGEIVGVACAAMHKEQRHYTVHLCGEAHRNPTFSIGMARMLMRHAEDQVLEEGA